MHTTRPARLRRTILAGGVALVIAASALGAGAYSYLKPTATASTPITAVPLTTMATNDSAAEAVSVAASDATVYEIQSSASTASFIVDEVLRGSPYTVVGTTDQVAGRVGYSYRKFFLATFLGKTLRFLLVALLGGRLLPPA